MDNFRKAEITKKIGNKLIIDNLDPKNLRSKIISLTLSLIIWIVAISLTLFFYDWKLLLILLLFGWSNNLMLIENKILPLNKMIQIIGKSITEIDGKVNKRKT